MTKTKTHASLLIVLIAVICLGRWATSARSQPAARPERTAWEYKTIVLTRSVGSEFSWTDDGQALNGAPNMVAKSKELGEQGWELVTITPVASEIIEGRTGFTNSVQYWFKRPK
jgi:hypothetical protein